MGGFDSRFLHSFLKVIFSTDLLPLDNIIMFIVLSKGNPSTGEGAEGYIYQSIKGL